MQAGLELEACIACFAPLYTNTLRLRTSATPADGQLSLSLSWVGIKGCWCNDLSPQCLQEHDDGEEEKKEEEDDDDGDDDGDDDNDDDDDGVTNVINR